MNCAYISMKDYHAFVHDILSMSLFHLELSDTSFYQLVNAFDSLWFAQSGHTLYVASILRSDYLDLWFWLSIFGLIFLLFGFWVSNYVLSSILGFQFWVSNLCCLDFDCLQIQLWLQEEGRDTVDNNALMGFDIGA